MSQVLEHFDGAAHADGRYWITGEIFRKHFSVKEIRFLQSFVISEAVLKLQ